LVKHFNGLLEPTQGRVIVEGKDAGGQSVTQLSQQVGYCFQNPDHQICCKTVREEFIFGPANLGVDEAVIRSRMGEIAGRMGLEAVFEKRPFGLSKGERQKLAVASILMMEPNVVIIDEPTTGQDYRMGREMMELASRLHSEGKTVIVITHDMGIVAEYVDRVVALREGQVLLDGSAREVFMRSDVLAMTSLEPPQITRLGQELNEFGISADVLTVEEMLREVKRALESEPHSSLEGSEQRPGEV
jgi:energy-coupling factor transporter ATP-binding protein EcfA2